MGVFNKITHEMRPFAGETPVAFLLKMVLTLMQVVHLPFLHALALNQLRQHSFEQYLLVGQQGL